MPRWMAFDLEVYTVLIEVFVYSTDEEQLRHAMNRLAQSEAVLGGALANAVGGSLAKWQRPRLCQGSVVAIP